MYVRKSSIGEGHCRSCGAPITWVENIDTKKKNPIDGHGVEFEDAGLMSYDGRLVDAAEVDFGPHGRGGAHTSHFATCPNAKTHRRRG